MAQAQPVHQFSLYPAVEWDWTSPCSHTDFALDDNWIHDIFQASDGNFICSGFSDLDKSGGDDGFRHPAIFKLNPKFRANSKDDIVWETISTAPPPTGQPDLEINLDNAFSGGFNDAIEVAEQEGRFIYVVGVIFVDAATSGKKKNGCSCEIRFRNRRIS